MSSPPTVRLGLAGSSRIKLRELSIQILSGPDAGRAHRGAGPIRIGKGADNDLVLADASVSRNHLELVDVPEGWCLRDLGSTNGTLLDEVRVKEAFLPATCTVALGGTKLKVETLDRTVPVPDHAGASFHGLIGHGPAMRQLFAHLALLARTPLSVIVEGETGTGKELVAQALHRASPRAAGPFVTFDCGSTEPSLVGAALFGHTEGAFTGAAARRKGAFVSAHGGTLFLDEIGELPLDLQPRLLRALERREVQPLGSDEPAAVDVRVVSATHRDLSALVREGKFREDLLYRLAGLVLVMPPLRDRPEEIAPLAAHLLQLVSPGASFTAAARDRLAQHAWPGNVRELKNVVDRAALLAQGPAIDAEHILIGALRLTTAPAAAPAPVVAAPSLSLDEAERTAILKALKAANGNKTQAARLLGIARNTLRDRMERLGIKED